MDTVVEYSCVDIDIHSNRCIHVWVDGYNEFTLDRWIPMGEMAMYVGRWIRMCIEGYTCQNMDTMDTYVDGCLHMWVDVCTYR